MDRSLIARAQQIIAEATEQITGRDALRQAVHEKYQNNPEALLDAFVDASMSGLRELRKRTYELPDSPTLFDLPSVIGVRSPDGDLYVHLQDATAGQVQQWASEGEQYHGSQRRRFKAIRKQVKELDSAENFQSQVRALASKVDQ
jgi:hypothetical protein